MPGSHSIDSDLADGHRLCVLHSREADVRVAFATDLGMLACSLRNGGDELLGQEKGLDGYVRTGATMGIALLHPWANRLGGFGYRFGGRDVALRGGFPVDERGLPLHGLLGAVRNWTPTGAGADDDHAWAGAELDAAAREDVLAGFPFPHALRVDARLRGGTLTVETTLSATGDVPVPVCFGYHPYFRLPGVPRALWEVELPVARRLELDDRKLPTGRSEAVTPIRGALGERTFDDAYVVAAGEGPFVLAGGGRRISVAFEQGYGYAQVFAPGADDVVCFEPMTAPGDALRQRPEQLTAVAPGEEYRARFSITVQTA